MFGLFKKKSAPPPVRHGSGPSKLSPLSEEQKRLIKEELERHANDKGNDIDAAIGLLHLTGDAKYLQGLLKVLENADVGILLKDPHDIINHLTLTRDGLTYIPVFTQPHHSASLAEKFPAYKFMTFVNARKLFLATPLGFGLWINLGHPVFVYSMDPATFTAYRAVLSKIPA